MSAISLFEEKQVRRAWNSNEEKWGFAIVDVIAMLTESPNPQVCWRVMKKRLTDEGNETVTNCSGLKMTADDGKQRMCGRHHALAQAARVRWNRNAFWPGVTSARDHVEIEWFPPTGGPLTIGGPIVMGAGAHVGLGLFAPLSKEIVP